MKKSYLKMLILLSALFFLVSGCENDYPDSIYNPNETFKPNPVISTISPEVAFAGVDTVTITGQNFSSVSTDVEVFFNGQKGKTVLSTTDMVKVIPPNVIGDSIKVQLRVAGALKYAELKPYKLEPIMIAYGAFDNFDNTFGIACDASENVYVSLLGNKLVQNVTLDLERHDYATLKTDKASKMAMGPDGYIYYVFGAKFLLRILPGGGSDELFAVLPGGAFDLDFDENLNIYSGGNGKAVYRTTPDKQTAIVKQYPNTYIHALRVFNGYLYVAGSYSEENTSNVVDKLWRNQIIPGSDTLGTTELVLDFDSKFVGKRIQSLAISEDGNIYLGTNADDGIYVLKSDGSFGALYSDIIQPDIYAMYWGNNQFLYMCRRFIFKDSGGEEKETGEILRINMRKKTAPYYGRK